jgi:hypothetical protein
LTARAGPQAHKKIASPTVVVKTPPVCCSRTPNGVWTLVSDLSNLNAVPVTGGAPTTITTLAGQCPVVLTVQGRAVYWIDNCTSSINVVTF